MLSDHFLLGSSANQVQQIILLAKPSLKEQVVGLSCAGICKIHGPQEPHRTSPVRASPTKYHSLTPAGLVT